MKWRNHATSSAALAVHPSTLARVFTVACAQNEWYYERANAKAGLL